MSPPVRPVVTPIASPVSRWRLLAVSGAARVDDNAIAHERNVRFVAESLARLGVARGAQQVLFADGPDPAADVHYEEADPVERQRLYALGLLRTDTGRARDAMHRFVNHTVPDAEPADLASVERVLRADATRAVASAALEPLLLYVTDHGRDAPRHDNGYIVLWGDRDIDVHALADLLDVQPPRRRIVAVMSQCYSGAFAALVYQHGDPRRPIAGHDRCGFFAAPSDRQSAGCTPETDESRYDDYTTWFFAALAGRDRTGHAVRDADRDGDGVVSLAEAHRYALLHDETTDVPVSSSEEYLRAVYARWLAALRARRTVVRDVLATARPELRDDARVLLAGLDLDEGVTISGLVNEARHRRATCAPVLCEALDALDAARTAAHRSLRAAVRSHRVPGVASADVTALSAPAADALVRAAGPYLAAIEGLEATTDVLAHVDDRDEARLERVRRLAELAALEAHARAEGGDTLAAYDRIRRCENDHVGP